MPTINSSSKYGLAVEVPYYWALAPDYDATIAPMITTKQGPLLQGEFRQRLINGAYSIRAAGIHQFEPSYFVHNDGSPTPGYRDWRGSVESDGQFALNSRWIWGWDALMLIGQDFPAGLQPASVALPRRRSATDRHHRRRLAALSHRQGQSQLFRRPLDLLSRLLRSRRAEPDPGHPSGDRLHLHVRSSGARRRTRLQHQLHQPDAQPGQFRCHHADRAERRHLRADRRPGDQEFGQLPACAASPAPTAASRRRRIGAQAITDSFGQVFTPFASLRADAGSMQINSDPGVVELHRHRQQRSGARHADGRPRIPLSVHQRGVLGHADAGADRPGDRAAERDRRSANGRTRTRKA